MPGLHIETLRQKKSESGMIEGTTAQYQELAVDGFTGATLRGSKVISATMDASNRGRGLLAMMLLHESRRAARVDDSDARRSLRCRPDRLVANRWILRSVAPR